MVTDCDTSKPLTSVTADTAQGSSSFVPNNAAPRARKGQEHRLNDSGAFHSGGHIAHDDTDYQAGYQRIAEYSAAPGIADIPGGHPIPQS